jgi:hypothetical protein
MEKGTLMLLLTARRAVLAKLLVTALLVSSCAVPLEEHGGLSPRPAAPDAVFIGGGVALDGGLAALKVPAVPRLLVDAGAMWAVRVPQWGGRTESAHLLVFSGAFLREWLAGMIRGLR